MALAFAMQKRMKPPFSRPIAYNKKDVSLIVKRLPFCGCQDSNLEPFGS